MKRSESIKNLAVALGKAQGEIGNVRMDGYNPFYKSHYTTLGEIIKVAKPALEKNGLVVIPMPDSNVLGTGVTTLLVHSPSGEWVESTITIPLDTGANTAQEAGKAITYFRRYSLAALLNIYADEDTDAQDPAKKTSVKKASRKKPAKKLDTPMSLEMAESITGAADGVRYGDCTNEMLDKKMMGIVKVLNNKETDPGKMETYSLKRDAIITIRAYRKED